MIGCAGKSGFNGNMVVDPKDARFKHPTGIVIFSSVKKEYAVVADNGNNVLRMISNVSSLRTKKKISTIKIQNLDKDGFKPSILAKHVNTSILVSSTNSKSIYVLLIFPGNATAICLTEVPLPSLTQTCGMAFLPSTKELLIGNEENLLIINVQSVCSPLLMEKKIGEKSYFENNQGKPIFSSRELNFAPISHDGKFLKRFHMVAI